MNYQNLTADLIDKYQAQLPKLKRRAKLMRIFGFISLALFIIALIGGVVMMVMAILFAETLGDATPLFFLIGYIAYGTCGVFLILMILLFVLRRTVVIRKIRNRKAAIEAYNKIVKYMVEILDNEGK